jgi:hypothetical protein
MLMLWSNGVGVGGGVTKYRCCRCGVTVLVLVVVLRNIDVDAVE